MPLSDISKTSVDRTSRIQRWQYRFVYISDDDEQPTTTESTSLSTMNTTLNLITHDEDETSPTTQHRTAQATNHTR